MRLLLNFKEVSQGQKASGPKNILFFGVDSFKFLIEIWKESTRIQTYSYVWPLVRLLLNFKEVSQGQKASGPKKHTVFWG